MQLVEHLSFVKQITTQKEKQPKLRKHQHYSQEELETFIATFPATKLWTYSEVQKTFPHESRIELFNHQLICMPSPSLEHQEIVFDLAISMKNHASQTNMGKVIISPFDVKFDEGNVVQPDIIYVSKENEDKIDKKCVKGSPDIVVEVLSSNKKDDLEKKKDLYEKNQVPEYWLVNPKKQAITVNVLEQTKYAVFSEATKKGTVKSSVLGGFVVWLENLFK